MGKITKSIISAIKVTISEVDNAAIALTSKAPNTTNITRLNNAIDEFCVEASALKEKDTWNVKLILITSLEKVMTSLYKPIANTSEESKKFVAEYVRPEIWVKLQSLIPDSVGGQTINLYEELKKLEKKMLAELELTLLHIKTTTSEHLQELDKRTKIEADKSLFLVIKAKIEAMLELEKIKENQKMEEKAKKDWAIGQIKELKLLTDKQFSDNNLQKNLKTIIASIEKGLLIEKMISILKPLTTYSPIVDAKNHSHPAATTQKPR